MHLTLKDDLPFTTVTIAYLGQHIDISSVLIDTGSASTILNADLVATIGITPDPQDILHTIRGVGGTEVVFTRQVDHLQVGTRSLNQFEIEVGEWIMVSKLMASWEWIFSSALRLLSTYMS